MQEMSPCSASGRISASGRSLPYHANLFVTAVCGDDVCVHVPFAAHENGHWEEKSSFVSDTNKLKFTLYCVRGENFTTLPLI